MHRHLCGALAGILVLGISVRERRMARAWTAAARSRYPFVCELVKFNISLQ